MFSLEVVLISHWWKWQPLAIRFSSVPSYCIYQALLELIPFPFLIFRSHPLLHHRPSGLPFFGLLHIPLFHRSTGLIVTFLYVLLLRFVSRWVGKAKAVDLTFCPWCYKPMEDLPSILTFPRTLLYKWTSNTQSKWRQQHTSQRSLKKLGHGILATCKINFKLKETWN